MRQERQAMYIVIDLKTGAVCGRRKTMQAALNLAEVLSEAFAWDGGRELGVEVAE